MVKPDDPIYPIKAESYSDFGLTVRAWMATQIAAGYRASKPAAVSPVIAELAVRDADALIKELNK